MSENESKLADLPPGRELDKLVAEKVFGYEIITKKETRYAHLQSVNVTNWDAPPQKYEVDEYFIRGEGLTAVSNNVIQSNIGFIPHYSTDIAAAWQVLEQFPHFELYRLGAWFGCSILGGQEGEDVNAKAPTAPHAISLSAIKAKADLL